MAAEGVFSSEDKSQHKDEVVRARRKMNESSGIMESLIQKTKMDLIKCGWRDGMLRTTKELIGSRGGAAEITLAELVAEVTENGILSVPNEIKSSIISQLRESLNEGNSR